MTGPAEALAVSIRAFLREVDERERATPEPAPVPVPPARPVITCPYCQSVHVADAQCRCAEPCGVGFCPATVEEGWVL